MIRHSVERVLREIHFIECKINVHVTHFCVNLNENLELFIGGIRASAECGTYFLNSTNPAVLWLLFDLLERFLFIFSHEASVCWNICPNHLPTVRSASRSRSRWSLLNYAGNRPEGRAHGVTVAATSHQKVQLVAWIVLRVIGTWQSWSVIRCWFIKFHVFTLAVLDGRCMIGLLING